MIPDFKTYIGESTWNDIRKQSSGTKTRREEDVDLMSPMEFYEYLASTYVPKFKNDSLRFFNDEHSLVIIKALCANVGGIYTTACTLRYYIPDKILHIDMYNTKYVKSDLLDIMKKEYPGFESGKTLQRPDGKKITNSFVVEVLDFILDNAKPPLYSNFKEK